MIRKKIGKGVKGLEMTKLKGILTEKKKTYEDCSSALDMSTATFNNKIRGLCGSIFNVNNNSP